MRRLTRSTHQRTFRQPLRERRGLVLVIVTIVVIMASLAGFSFVALMATENKAVHSRGTEMQLEAAIASGVEFLKVVLEQPNQFSQSSGRSFPDADAFRGVPVFQDENGETGCRFSVISPLIADGKITGIRFGLTDESSRLNLATLLEWDRTKPGSARAALMNFPNMTESIADALLDWIDADSQQRQFGAETDYYASLEPPYEPRNGMPESIEELLLVRDITRGLLFGADTNDNYQVEAAEQRYAAQEGFELAPDTLPWSLLLTLRSAEQNTRPDGRPRINVNDRDLTRLYQQLTEVFDDNSARFIIAYRQYGPYKGSRTPENNASFEIDFSQQARYSLDSLLDLVDVNVRIRNGDTQHVIASPFSSDRNRVQEYLPRVIDQLSLTDAKVIAGRINVDEAPREVLLAIPGLERAVVDRIVAARNTQSTGTATSGHNASWLVADGVIDLDTMKRVLPFVTTRGDVYRGQVVGFLDDPGPVKRAEVMIDSTTVPARQVYWKDLGVFGPGFSRETLGAMSTVESADDL